MRVVAFTIGPIDTKGFGLMGAEHVPDSALDHARDQPVDLLPRGRRLGLRVLRAARALVAVLAVQLDVGEEADAQLTSSVSKPGK
jgi:hypothetical protein